MPEISHALVITVIMGIATLVTRIVPVLVFGRGKKVPDYIMYLGRVVPYTAMGLLIIYCLKDASIMTGSHLLPELIALAIVAGTYIWKRNTISSVVIGTVIYMFLVQMVF